MNYKESLEHQIRDACGKIIYAYACQWAEIAILKKWKNIINYTEIVLTAITATSIIGSLIINERLAQIVAAIASTINLGIYLYTKEYNAEYKIIKRQTTADDLWKTRERYISLLTDLPILDESEIRATRDRLLEDSAQIYKASLPTSNEAYEEARKQLKNEEYQYFTRQELNVMFPEHLRK